MKYVTKMRIIGCDHLRGSYTIKIFPGLNGIGVNRTK